MDIEFGSNSTVLNVHVQINRKFFSAVILKWGHKTVIGLSVCIFIDPLTTPFLPAEDGASKTQSLVEV